MTVPLSGVRTSPYVGFGVAILDRWIVYGLSHGGQYYNLRSFDTYAEADAWRAHCEGARVR